ncbi:putative flagellar associated protein [Paratrimastix pyriformis]|uniref:Cilia- and flagella-associated protein 53 n=1 Tax=Paratrimastix pyriformis TaxID=342808 RepID=A0ABQ8UC68_9EUKA|nr:putative flagellar associated protein [Paratrimastix pyriformis]
MQRFLNQPRPQVEVLRDRIRTEAKLRNVADWEHKTDKIVADRAVQRTIQQLREQRQRDLEERRKRLAALLEADDRRYADEFLARQETPEQIKARMEARARELNARHEAERTEFAQRMLDKQWKDECDDLRGLVQKQQLMQVFEARGRQIEEKKLEKLQQREEAQLWSEVEEQERQKKIEREERELQQKEALHQQTLEVLREQIAMREEHRAEEARLKEEEAALDREQAELAKRQQEEEEANQLRLKQSRMHELRRFNRVTHLRKLDEMRREKEADLEFLRQVNEREQYEMEREQMVKDRHRQEALAYRQQLIATWAREKDESAELDRLCEEERDREYQKREAQWAREKAARDQLKKEVIEERQRQIATKRALKQREMEENQAEQQRLQAEIERMQAEQEQEAADRERRHQENLHDLRVQMRDHEAHKHAQEEQEVCVAWGERRLPLAAEKAKFDAAQREYEARLQRERGRIQAAIPVRQRALAAEMEAKEKAAQTGRQPRFGALSPNLSAIKKSFRSWLQRMSSEFPDINFAALKYSDLRRLTKFYHLRPPGATKEELINALFQHFATVPTSEDDTIVRLHEKLQVLQSAQN